MVSDSWDGIGDPWTVDGVTYGQCVRSGALFRLVGGRWEPAEVASRADRGACVDRWTLVNDDALTAIRSLPDQSVDAVVTDPPYGINTKSDGTGKLNPWADLCNAALWYSSWIGQCRRVLKPTGSLWSCLNWRSLPTFQKAACDVAWPIESLAVWDKAWIGPGGPRGLRPSYEMIALWCMDEFAIPDRGVPDVVRVKWSGFKPHSHPAEKPEGLVEWVLDTAAVPSGGLVVDLFSGSGTTGAVCVRRGLRFWGCEMDAVHHRAASARIASASEQTQLFDRSLGGDE